MKLADMTAVIGGSGTGKTSFMLSELARRKPTRLLVWDPEGELHHLGIVTNDLAEAAQISQADRWSIVYVPPFDRDRAEQAFNVFCRIAFKRAQEGRAPLMLIDELATVVHSNGGPEYWTACVSRGRKRGLVIMAASLRPAKIDKDFWSLATRIRCTALNYEPDQKAMAAALAVPLAQVRALNGFESIDIDRNARVRRTKMA